MAVTVGPLPFDRPAPRPQHRAPRDCPVCSNRLDVTQLGCPTCGTGLTGQFRPCEFCGLDDADREVLRVFLVSRGNMKELERHLGVSYPTVRARFDDLLRRLDLGGAGARPEPTGRAGVPEAGTARRPTPDPRLETLRALAEGELGVDDARQRLERPPGTEA
jgi:hypothetical protein